MNTLHNKYVQSSLLLSRNVRWPRRMLSSDESRWVCWRDRRSDGRTI